MVNRITAVLLSLLMSIAIVSCGKDKTDQADGSANGTQKKVRKVIDYGDHLNELADIDISCPDFARSGDIEKTLIFNDKGIEITAESIEYTDDHAELKLTVQNSNSYTMLFEKSKTVVNYFQEPDTGIFAVDPNSTETWIYNINYFPVSRFGVEQIDTLQFGFRLYEYKGKKQDISEDTLSASLLGNTKSVTSDEGYIFASEVIRTSNFQDIADRIDEYDQFLLGYSSGLFDDKMENAYFPEDPLIASSNSGYIDQYFLQNTQNITLYTKTDSIYYQITSAAYGEIENESCPGNKWYQYAFYNFTNQTVSIRPMNVVINGLSVASHLSTISDTQFLPGTTGLVHDILFPSYFNKAHWDIYGIDDYHTISFDFEVIPQGETSGTLHRAKIYFDKEYEEVDRSGTTVYDKDNISVISKGIYENAAYYEGDYTEALLICNNSYEDIYISAPLNNSYSISDEISYVKVNGEPASGYIRYKNTFLKIPAGCCGEYLIYLDAPSLRKKQIKSVDKINELSFKLDIRDSYQRLIDEAEIKIKN